SSGLWPHYSQEGLIWTVRQARRSCLRSPSRAALEVRIFSARRLSVLDSGDVNRGSTVAGDATGSPHSKQNFAPAGSSLRHFVQVSATRAPHSKQNFAWGGFSCWHRGHFMPEPPSSLAGEGRNGGPRVTARLSHGQGHRCDNRFELRRGREVRGADGATPELPGVAVHTHIGK